MGQRSGGREFRDRQGTQEYSIGIGIKDDIAYRSVAAFTPIRAAALLHSSVMLIEVLSRIHMRNFLSSSKVVLSRAAILNVLNSVYFE